MRKIKGIVVSCLILIAIIPFPVSAGTIGVGVGTGKITVREPIKTGGVYRLPSIVVYNTGTQEATYTVTVTLNEKQAQLKPDPEWFSFSPKEFKLKPKQSQIVTPSLNAPLQAREGEYFAYLEAQPAKTVTQGSASIGVAAATKLSFTLESSNIFMSLLLRLQGLYVYYKPWSSIGLAAFIATLVLLLFNRFINLGAAFRAFWVAGRRPKQKQNDED